MSDQPLQRRLEAILAADVAGYTRLMEEDTEGTVAAWKTARDDVIDPTIAAHLGRTVKLTGDGFLAEFPSVLDAVHCAIALQEKLASSPLDFRMGINLGDVLDDGKDIYGEGVNLAARLEGITDPGGICISGSVYEQVRNRIDVVYEDRGERELKNVSAPLRVYAIRMGRAGIAPNPDELAAVAGHVDSADRQRVTFCTSADETRLAMATTGDGYPLVKTGHWLTHLEHDWHSPIWHPFLTELGTRFQVTRYDARGNGLSDWSVADFGFERFVEDLEAVVDAAGLDRFALYGTSQGAPVSVAYAVRHPERVSHLILHGGYVQGRTVRGSIEEREQGEAMLTLIRHNWGKTGSPFLKAFSSLFIPTATTEQIDSLVELQRQSTTPENAANLRAAVDRFDVTNLVDRVVTPTLVAHARDDGVQPLEEGRKLAAGIRNSEFLMLDSTNHVILEHEPAWNVLFSVIRGFVLD